jgi:hypothetical protein
VTQSNAHTIRVHTTADIRATTTIAAEVVEAEGAMMTTVAVAVAAGESMIATGNMTGATVVTVVDTRLVTMTVVDVADTTTGDINDATTFAPYFIRRSSLSYSCMFR